MQPDVNMKITKLVLSILLGVVVYYSLLFVFPNPVSAAASISLSPSSGYPSDILTITGTGFPMSLSSPSTAYIFWDGRQLSSLSVLGGGSFTTSISVPANATQGLHTVKATMGTTEAAATYTINYESTTTTLTTAVVAPVTTTTITTAAKNTAVTSMPPNATPPTTQASPTTLSKNKTAHTLTTGGGCGSAAPFSVTMGCLYPVLLIIFLIRRH